MSTGNGIDKVGSEGHSAADARQIEAALWAAPGIASGLGVATQPGNRVTVAPGVVVVSWADGGMSRVPVSGTSLTLQPPHPSLARSDRIVVRQPRGDQGASSVAAVVEVVQGTPGGAAPSVSTSGSAIISTVTVPPSGGWMVEPGDMAVPRHSGGAIRYHWQDTSNSEYTGTSSSPLIRTALGQPGSRRYATLSVQTSLLSLTPSAEVMIQVWRGASQVAAWPIKLEGKDTRLLQFSAVAAYGTTYQIRHRALSGRYRGLYGPYQGDVYMGTVVTVTDGGEAL